MDKAPVCPVCRRPVLPDAPHGLCPECLLKTGFDTRSQEPGADGAARFIPPPAGAIGQLFPQLDVVSLLGQGGMGAVYKARQPALGRFVALKILPPRSGGDPGFAERFNREARALARLNHPNIVAVYDFGEAGGMSYFLMELVEGSTLRQVAQSGKLSPRETLGIVMQICEALQYAHDEGVVHRDIKPENILLDHKGRVKIADFGIAKMLHQEPQHIALTGAKDIVGTAQYMAPEQLEHPDCVDHRADIFSLGVVFYELLTGELPLGKFAPPSHKVRADARLDQVVLHTLEKEPDRRYQRASQVKDDVHRIANSAGKPAPWAEPGHWPPWKAIVWAGGCVLLALAVFLGLAAFRSKPSLKPRFAQTIADGPRSDAALALLNADQRLVLEWTAAKYHRYEDRRNFDGWPDSERLRLERRCLDTLRGPRTAEFLQAVNALAALRSTNAVPLLRELALERSGRPMAMEGITGGRWMATRALGRIGDKTVVPDLIHLLYRNNTFIRWCAQISLVELTGQNFGGDWRAWGKWWNAQGGQPPFGPEMIRWFNRQPGADKLAVAMAELDRKFIAGLNSHPTADPPTAETEEN